MDFSSNLPLYESIKREFQQRIESGSLAVGDRILPEIALAQKLGVSRSTARKALQLLEQAGYIHRTAGRGSFVQSPEAYLGALAQTKRPTVVLALPAWEAGDSLGKIAQGFLQAAISEDCAARVLPSQSSHSPLLNLCSSQRSLDREAWALWAPGIAQEMLAGLAMRFEKGGALLLLDYESPFPRVDALVSQDEEMARVLSEELLRRGHQNIAFFASQTPSPLLEARLAGYQGALKAAGIVPEEGWLVHVEPDDPSLMQMKILQLLGQRRRPTALLCASEAQLDWLIQEVSRLHYSVPEDIELTVVDGHRLCASQERPVLWSRTDAYAMGQRALRLLLERLENPDREAQLERVPYQLSY